MSFLLLLLLSGNSILSFNSCRVSMARFCTPKDAPRVFWGSNDGGLGDNTGITCLLAAWSPWESIIVPTVSCVSPFMPAAGIDIPPVGPLFVTPCSFCPLPRPTLPPPTAVFAVISPPHCVFYLRCLHVEFGSQNSYVGCTRLIICRIKNYV